LVACGGTANKPGSPAAVASASAAAASASAAVEAATLPNGQKKPGAGASGSNRSANPSASGSRAPGAQPSPSPSYPDHIPGTTPATVTASLASTCVTPAGSQTLTIHTHPGYYLGFDTQYSDGKDGKQYGGVDTTQVPGTGVYTNTWVVSPQAPLGDAVVYIALSGMDHTSAFRQLYFKVASHC
jgi:hypothetical protein